MTGSGLVSCGASAPGSVWALLALLGLLRARRIASSLPRRPSRAGAPAVVVAALLVPSVPRAEPREVPADVFLPAMDSTGFLGVDSGRTTGQYSLDAGLLGSYLGSPLVLSTRNADGELVRVPVVERLFMVHVTGAVGVRDGVEVGVVLPAVVSQTRDQAAIEATGSYVGVPLAPQGLGDLQVRAKIALLRRHASGWDLALMPTLSLPTATAADAFLGEAGPVFQPELALSRDIESVRLSVNGGLRLRGTPARVAQLVLENEATLRAAVRWAVGLVPVDNGVVPIELGFAVAGRAPLDELAARPHQLPLEAMVGLGAPVLPWLELNAGFGVGIIGGYGVPDARAIVGVRLVEHDSDSDTVGDPRDRCADDPEDLDSFEDRDGCPEADNDRDGVLDADDRCPTVAGAAEAEAPGCPLPDGDNDGVPDGADACPAAHGTVAARGCPDKDGDGVPDAADACPGEPDVRPEGAPSDGCPIERVVNISGRLIVPAEKLRFDVAGAGLRVESFASLDHVARLLRRMPEIRKVRAEGHCSDFEDEQENQRASEERARAVVAYLVRAGIEPDRLDALGHGSSRPLARNDNPINRERNRRVVLTIVEREGQGPGSSAEDAEVAGPNGP